MERRTRIYRPECCQIGAVLPLDQKIAHYLRTVLRCRWGAEVGVFGPSGGDYIGILGPSTSRSHPAQLVIQEYAPQAVTCAPQLTLYQGICRVDRMEWILQKGVELGLSVLQPVCMARTQGRERDRLARLAPRWEEIAQHAAAQCGRVSLLKLRPPVPFAVALAADLADHRWICLPKVAAVPEPVVEAHATRSVWVGPEGGMTAEEQAALWTPRAIPLGLGPRILRTETATLAALVWIQSRHGDWA